MDNIQKHLSHYDLKHILEMAKIVAKIGKQEKLKVYIVGGVVRDIILGRKIQDIDLMVEGNGILFAKKLADVIGVKKIVSYEKFGTALIPNKLFQIEVASSRSESYDYTSRNPSVVNNVSIKEDLKRRDFTINAMAMDISEDKFGDVIDPFGGINDLRKSILRTPLDPDKTFSDDPLRMMRAAYFASKLNFKIESSCRASIITQAKRIKIVS